MKTTKQKGKQIKTQKPNKKRRIKIHIPKIMHKSSKNIPELTGSKSDPLKPCTIAIDTDWNINDLEQFLSKEKFKLISNDLQSGQSNM
jgi:hypothetical protein